MFVSSLYWKSASLSSNVSLRSICIFSPDVEEAPDIKARETVKSELFYPNTDDLQS